jgi:putative two-component system response regulator
MEKPAVLLVDDNPANLIAGEGVLEDKYEVLTAGSAEEMFALLEKKLPAIILLDINMPGMNGYEAIAKLKASPDTADIPVIFLTAKSDTESELEGLRLGAADYVSKPFSPPILLKRIENHLTMEAQKGALRDYANNLEEMVKKRTVQVEGLQNTILDAVAELVEARDGITGGHIMRTQKYISLLVKKMAAEKVYRSEAEKWNLHFFVPSARLHDVGKIAISDVILNKPGRLSADEFEIMKGHAAFGEAAIDAIMQSSGEKEFLSHARSFAGSHHEKWDGSGYPRRLKGQEIPIEGRLMAVADVYDALISRRPYKEPLSAADSAQIIIDGRGTNFDPAIIELFQGLKEDFAAVASGG